jgi:hypothetical protein
MNSKTLENPHNTPCDPHNKVDCTDANSALPAIANSTSVSTPPALPEKTGAAATTPAASREPDHIDRIIAMIPKSAWERRFRADSFASQLTPQQVTTLCEWFNTLSVPQVQARIAAAPPEGFGKSVQQTTLYRLKKSLQADAPHWLANSLDTAVDLLASEEAGAIAPLREALSVMLYSRAMACCENQADIPTIDRLLSAITKLEKLKSPPAPRSSSPRVSPPPSRHQVELSIVHPAQRQHAEVISVQPESLPSPEKE